MEARALQLEDLAKLSKSERDARRVARLMLADPNLALGDIETTLGVSRSTASELRQEATALIQGGYRIEQCQQLDHRLDLMA